MNGRIARSKVWNAAIDAKLSQRWCDEGFNSVMTELGFPEVETFTEYVVPDGTPEPTTRIPDDLYACDDKSCSLCWENPLPRSTQKTVLRFVETMEVIREL